MSSEDIVRAWKDPDHRAAADVDHPAGQIRLTGTDDDPVGGLTVPYVPCTTLWCATFVTQALSCQLWDCGDTVKQGTCDVASVGCCGTATVTQ